MASDGGIFAFGDASYLGSVPGSLSDGSLLSFNGQVVGVGSL
ncbi:MAG: hypothetical protein M0019_01100 [Actinomycetota bacterium]|nr:hypothetical protein [Actinomycetota bacterium]